MPKQPREGRVVLASDSPRRREIVAALDIHVETASPGGDEAPRRKGETPGDLVLRLSFDKARRVAARIDRAVVLGADTVVVLDGEVLGKPDNDEQAARMLGRLRGRAHTVTTGVTVLDARTGRRVSAVTSTCVTMRHYSDGETAVYVASGEPLDKAGAYAVQDPGFHPARSVEGCYLNVVGLPLCETVSLLRDLEVQARLRPDWQPPDQCRSCPLDERQEALRA